MVYKIAIISDDDGVGVTSYIHRIKTGEFIKHHIPTKEQVEHQLSFNTTRGRIDLKVLEKPNDEELKDVDGCIIVLDIFSPARLYFMFHPAVLCINKYDMTTDEDRAVCLHRNPGAMFISAKSCYNYELPFLYLLRTLTKNQNLKFVPEEPICPPSVNIESINWSDEIANIPLPD